MKIWLILCFIFFSIFGIQIFSVFATSSPDPQQNLYKLPYPAGKAYEVKQGNFGAFSHSGIVTYAFDFGLQEVDPVVA